MPFYFFPDQKQFFVPRYTHNNALLYFFDNMSTKAGEEKRHTQPSTSVEGRRTATPVKEDEGENEFDIGNNWLDNDTPSNKKPKISEWDTESEEDEQTDPTADDPYNINSGVMCDLKTVGHGLLSDAQRHARYEQERALKWKKFSIILYLQKGKTIKK